MGGRGWEVQDGKEALDTAKQGVGSGRTEKHTLPVFLFSFFI